MKMGQLRRKGEDERQGMGFNMLSSAMISSILPMCSLLNAFDSDCGAAAAAAADAAADAAATGGLDASATAGTFCCNRRRQFDSANQTGYALPPSASSKAELLLHFGQQFHLVSAALDPFLTGEGIWIYLQVA